MKREAKSKYIIHDELFSQLCVNYPGNILLAFKTSPLKQIKLAWEKHPLQWPTTFSNQSVSQR